MIIKNMTITNSRGDSITFGHHFKLMRDFDLGGTIAFNSYSQTTSDGSAYQRTVLENKLFDLPFFIHRNNMDSWWIEEKRKESYRVFNPKANPFRIDITTRGGEEYYLIANLEGVPSFPTGADNQNIGWQKGLLQFSANDPYFYKKDETKVDVATWISAFSFPLEVTSEGIEMGYRSQNLIANVINDGDSDTGMIIRFTALATVRNPKLINVNTYDEFQLNFEMIQGDIIEVSTYLGKKTVTLLRDDVELNIFNTIDLNSKFLQLQPGDNLFRYDAGFGVDNLEVVMIFTNRFVGV